MSRTKISVRYESDTLSPMELLMEVRKISKSPNFEITFYEALDYVGRTCSDTPTEVEK